MTRWLMAITIVFSVGAAGAFADEAPPTRFAIEAGKILTFDGSDTIINNGIVLVADGRIEKVGRRGEVEIPDGYKVIDHRNGWVTPGLVDCHNHIAGSLSDLNDGVYLTNPGLRTLDTVEPRNENLENALSGGVTTVLLIPGSGNNMSGFGTITKTFGNDVEEMVMRSPGSLKIAQAGNPERYWYRVGRRFMNWNLRQTLTKAQAYADAWARYEKGETPDDPGYDLVWNDLRGLFDHQYPVSVHTQIYQVYMTTITMLRDHFGLDVVTDHSTFDSYKLAQLIKERNMYAIVGPRQFHFDRYDRTINGCAARFAEQGVTRLGINTDAPVIAQEDLAYQATMACWYGWNDHYAAIKGLTRIPAESLGVIDRVGSLETGKDADIGLWTGSPVDPRSVCEMTMVDGKVAYDVNVKRRTR
ncbi:MAG TPA: amidohydrolase family protein [Phycisphaerae bacterium]|nr:amidohydrolase family protein [Phycisphaerae bacterium]HRW52301.1 amidohydrolase family protein [Phycisphaerae bacterium]